MKRWGSVSHRAQGVQWCCSFPTELCTVNRVTSWSHVWKQIFVSNKTAAADWLAHRSRYLHQSWRIDTSLSNTGCVCNTSFKMFFKYHWWAEVRTAPLLQRDWGVWVYSLWMPLRSSSFGLVCILPVIQASNWSRPASIILLAGSHTESDLWTRVTASGLTCLALKRDENYQSLADGSEGEQESIRGRGRLSFPFHVIKLSAALDWFLRFRSVLPICCAKQPLIQQQVAWEHFSDV